MTWLRGLLARLSPRDRRTLALGAAVMLAAWLALRVVPAAVRAERAASDRADLAATTLERARQALAAAPLVRESLAVRASRLVALAPRLVAGTTPAEAAAELSSLVSAVAARRRVRMVQQDARPDTTRSLFTRLSLQAEVEGDVAGITGWLADLEEGPTLVRIRSLTISASQPTAPSGQAEQLRARVVLEAWSSPPRGEN
jgi:hypothetical protein